MHVITPIHSKRYIRTYRMRVYIFNRLVCLFMIHLTVLKMEIDIPKRDIQSKSPSDCSIDLLIVPLFNASILRRSTNMPSCNVKVVTYHNATRYFSTINVTSNMLRCDMQTCHLFFVATHFSQPFISSSHSFLAAIHFSQPPK